MLEGGAAKQDMFVVNALRVAKHQSDWIKRYSGWMNQEGFGEAGVF